ncbi:Hypothetical predicted protein [Octopus vulgaris]|uniref:Uncharacterized protein n=1 Tax=Octopus vulgaris TaxID=6645 RepID=A0AA36F3I6_OCTVU|nr:Hypothetical predicted protein [Octopus vulgaris]
MDINIKRWILNISRISDVEDSRCGIELDVMKYERISFVLQLAVLSHSVSDIHLRIYSNYNFPVFVFDASGIHTNFSYKLVTGEKSNKCYNLGFNILITAEITPDIPEEIRNLKLKSNYMLLHCVN